MEQARQTNPRTHRQKGHEKGNRDEGQKKGKEINASHRPDSKYIGSTEHGDFLKSGRKGAGHERPQTD